MNRESGAFESGNTGVGLVEKVLCLVVASQHRGSSGAVGSSWDVDRNRIVLTNFVVEFSMWIVFENEFC